MGKTYYNFSSHSALNFPLIHRGRKIFVNFSKPINGVSRYLTTDELLAGKIQAHQWFRSGLIKLHIEVEEAPKAKVQTTAATAPSKSSYSILGKPMMAKIPTFSHPIPKEVKKPASVNDNAESVNAASDLLLQSQQQAEENAPKQEEGNKLTAEEIKANEVERNEDNNEGGIVGEEFTAEKVTSYLEAREYMVNVMGIQRERCSNKQAIAQVCQELGIDFPNYKL